VLALDASESMDYKTAETSRFEQAKALAAQLVRAARQGDGISVVLLGDPARAVIGAPAFNRDIVLKEIADLAVTHGGTDLTGSFAKIEEALAASDIPRKELVVLTDLQATSWNRSRTGADEGLKRLIAKLNARPVRSSVIDLGAGNDANHAVTDIRLDPAIVTPGAPATVQATVRNLGRAPGGSQRARLVVDGKIEGEELADIAPGEARTVAFSYTFTAPGDRTVEVQLDADALRPDDTRRLMVPVREAVRVLLVDGDPRPETLKSETAFLVEALSPEPGPGEPPAPIKPDVIAESQLVGRDLTPYDTVVLANVARFTPAEVAQLEGYLKQGGGVVFFGGDQVAADNYNQLLFNKGQGLLPAELGPIVGGPGKQETPFEFDPLGFAHPIIESFGGEAPGVTASLTSVRTSRYHRLKVPPGTQARVALAFAPSGDPAVVERPFARGRVVLVATSADPGWTSWPLHQSYPPVMEQVVLLAASGRSAERNLKVGQPLTQTFPATAAGAAVSVVRPAGAPGTAKLTAEGDVSLLRYDGTDLSGIYHAKVGPPVDREIDFAANPDPLESDPAKLDAAGLRAAMPGWDFHYDSDWKPLQANAASVGRRGELHRPLLWGVLGLLFLESLLAWKFGHHAPRAR
jgi:hypothetical protein